MKHTPGPWKETQPRMICREVPNPDYPHKSNCGLISRQVATICQYGPKAEKEANARLIVAAPELLSAAIKLMAVFDDLSKSNPGFLGKLVLQDYAQLNEALIEMPAAIRKATGGAQ
jgi:hypothetical protein